MIKKKILIITPHFWPENFLINEIAKKFSKNKIDTTILTGLPNYPSGEIYKSYRKVKKVKNYKYENIKIIRFPIIPRKKGSSFDLTRNYLSFLINGFKAIQNLKFHNYHIFVYAISPITTALLGIYLKKKFKIKLTLWIQDLWPDSISATNHINNSFILYCISKLVKYIYVNADNLIATSKFFVKNIRQYTNKKVHIVENSHFFSDQKFNNQKIQYKIRKYLKNYFCITYAGNLGHAQSIGTILKAAKILQNDKKILFLIIGDGAYKKQAIDFINLNKLNNIKILGPYAPEIITKICKKSNGLMLSLKKSKVLSMTIPNKFQTYLYCGVPIIAACDGITRQLIKNYKIGFSNKAESASGIVKSILKLKKINKKEIDKMSKRMRSTYRNNFEINKQIKKLEKIIF